MMMRGKVNVNDHNSPTLTLRRGGDHRFSL